jgi:hypothetical protein
MKSMDILTVGDLYPVLDQLKNLSSKLGQMKGLDDTLVYSNDSLAKLLGVCRRTLQGYRDKRKINYSKVGRRIFYRREDVENFLLTHSNALFNETRFSNRKKNSTYGK